VGRRATRWLPPHARLKVLRSPRPHGLKPKSLLPAMVKANHRSVCSREKVGPCNQKSAEEETQPLKLCLTLWGT
jgi:hypothetical protein